MKVKNSFIEEEYHSLSYYEEEREKLLKKLQNKNCNKDYILIKLYEINQKISFKKYKCLQKTIGTDNINDY